MVLMSDWSVEVSEMVDPAAMIFGIAREESTVPVAFVRGICPDTDKKMSEQKQIFFLEKCRIASEDSTGSARGAREEGISVECGFIYLFTTE